VILTSQVSFAGRRKVSGRTCFLFAAVAAVALAGCGARPRPSTIVLVSIDTLRSDHLPAYGYRGVATPAIDRLRGDGILFANAFAHAPLTLPSHVSIFSGRLPTEHGVRDNLGYAVGPELAPWLPVVMRDAGYATAGAVSSYVLRQETGIARGFDVFDDQIAAKETAFLGARSRSGGATVARALAWLQAQGERPCFLFVHVYEPHAPYTPPAPFAGAYPERPYDGEIAAVDAFLGEFWQGLDELRRYDGALIVLLSDHGEGLGDHGEAEHGILLYREALQVPLLVKLPGGERAGSRVERLVQLIDVAPTLTEAAGLRLSPDLSGRSLLADDPGPRRVYAESYYARFHYGWSELTALFDERERYIEAPEPELYDLAADPAERLNLLRSEPRRAAAWRRELADLRRDPAPAAAGEAREDLVALGYLGGRAAVRPERADPKSMLPTLRDLWAGLDLHRAGRHAGAVAAFERALAANPGAVDGWDYLGRSLRALGRHEDARRAFAAADRAAGGDADYRLAVAASELDMERIDAARDTLLAAIELGGGDHDFLLRLCRRLCRLDAPAVALEVLQAAGADRDAAAAETLSLVYLQLGRWGDAERSAGTAVTLDPGRAEAWNNLGVAAYRQGRRAEAVAAWRRALIADGAFEDARSNLRLAQRQGAGEGS
jgi:arylsulfatase A-like enzyme